MTVTINGTTGITTPGLSNSGADSATSQTLSGNLTFTGTGNRITGDYSNATNANRVMFQTSTANGNTNVNALPNGTSTTAWFKAFGSSDANNNSMAVFGTDSTAVFVNSDKLGTGSYVPLVLSTGGAERVRIDTAGNVGVGTASPITKLEVYGSGAATSNLGVTIQGTDNAAYGQYLQFRRNGSNSLIIGDAGAILGSGGGNALYYSYGTNYQAWFTNGTERMRIDSSGNVGIGTSSPTDILTLGAPSTAANQIRLNGNGNPAYFGATADVANISVNRRTVDGSIINTGKSAAYITLDGSSGGSTIYFNTAAANNTQPSERMRIDSSGNLLVGTTSALAGQNGLSVSTANRSVDAFVNIQAPNAAGYNANIYLECPGLIGSTIQLQRSSALLRIWNGSGTAGVTLSSGGTSWGTFSDERLKDIVEPIENAAQKVSSLRAVIGRYKTDDETKRRPMLIAQDVQKVLPEAVYGDKSEDDYLSLAYADTIPLLVAAIQELNEKLVQQAAEIAALKGAK